MSEDRKVKRRVPRAVGRKGILLIACMLATALFVPINQVRAQSTGKYFDNVVIIVMENEGICDILYGNISYWGMTCGTTQNTYMPYATSLAKKWGLTTHYNSTDTSGSAFSLKNYLALFSGQTWGCTSDDNPNSSTCTQNAWNSVNQNLVDRLPSPITWKAYMENMTSNCQTTDSSTYSAHHDPLVYFNDVVGNPTRCGQVVPAGTNGSLDSTLLNDLNSGSAPNLMWLTPNLCDDMHTICTGSNNQVPETCTSSNQTGCCRYSATYAQCLPVGDRYLNNLVPQVLSSYTFTHSRSALFITFDEGGTFCPNGVSTDDCVYSVWVGPAGKSSFSSSARYGHYSWLATLEDNWGFRGSCLSHDCPPTPILSEFFIPSVRLSVSPLTIYQTFQNGVPNTMINRTTLTLTSLLGFTGTVNVTISPYNTNPLYGPVVQFSKTGNNTETFTLTANGQISDTLGVYSCRTTPSGVWTFTLSVVAGAPATYVTFTDLVSGTSRIYNCPLAPSP